MTPELEVLEQIVDSSLPLAAIAGIFPDSAHCHRALEAMLRDQQILIRDSSGAEVPVWRFSALVEARDPWLEGSGYRVHITDRGADMVG